MKRKHNQLRVAIAGMSGYLGTVISKKMREAGHEVFGISRSQLYGDVHQLAKLLSDSDAVVNLAGASILRRWTARNRKIISNSRIVTTQNLVNAIKAIPEKKRPTRYVTASAIGIYKSGEKHDESSENYDNEFVGKVVQDWEGSLVSLPEGVKVTVFRIGLVLGRKAKTIKNLLPILKLGLGGSIGSGRQAFPFVHEQDVARAFVSGVENDHFAGVYNLVTPDQINFREFVRKFAGKLNRPAFFTVPDIAVKLVLGKASVLLLESPVVIPKALQESGFSFQYPDIDSALSEILN